MASCLTCRAPNCACILYSKISREALCASCVNVVGCPFCHRELPALQFPGLALDELATQPCFYSPSPARLLCTLSCPHLEPHYGLTPNRVRCWYHSLASRPGNPGHPMLHHAVRAGLRLGTESSVRGLHGGLMRLLVVLIR